MCSPCQLPVGATQTIPERCLAGVRVCAAQLPLTTCYTLRSPPPFIRHGPERIYYFQSHSDTDLSQQTEQMLLEGSSPTTCASGVVRAQMRSIAFRLAANLSTSFTCDMAIMSATASLRMLSPVTAPLSTSAVD